MMRVEEVEMTCRRVLKGCEGLPARSTLTAFTDSQSDRVKAPR